MIPNPAADDELLDAEARMREHFGPEFYGPRSRGFWRIFRRGGMAEWSMAVVLKTTPPVLSRVRNLLDRTTEQPHDHCR